MDTLTEVSRQELHQQQNYWCPNQIDRDITLHDSQRVSSQNHIARTHCVEQYYPMFRQEMARGSDFPGGCLQTNTDFLFPRDCNPD